MHSLGTLKKKKEPRESEDPFGTVFGWRIFFPPTKQRRKEFLFRSWKRAFCAHAPPSSLILSPDRQDIQGAERRVFSTETEISPELKQRKHRRVSLGPSRRAGAAGAEMRGHAAALGAGPAPLCSLRPRPAGRASDLPRAERLGLRLPLLWHFRQALCLLQLS